MPTFDSRALQEVFLEIGRRARAAGKIAEIAVYGGSAIMLIFPARAATKDVDAVVESGVEWFRATVAEIGAERGWPESWINDGVKGFLSRRDKDPEARQLFRTYPSESEPGFRVFVPTRRYLLAMKCMAMRISGVEGTQDRSDIEMLARDLQVNDAEQAIALVREFYPDIRISPKTQFGIEEIFSPRVPPGGGPSQ